MKKLVIAYCNIENAITYKKQIKSIFHDQLSVEIIDFKKKEKLKNVEADLVLVTSKKVFYTVREYVKSHIEIVIGNITLSKAGLEKIKTLPPNINGIVIDEDKEMAEKIVWIIYRLGLRNLKLYPYSNKKEYKDKFDIGIIVGESKDVSKCVNRSINIGYCLLDISTILDIGCRVELWDILQNQNIKKSFKEMVTPNFGLSQIISNVNRSDSQLDILSQVIEDGVIAVDYKGIVYSYNDRARKIMGYRKNKVINMDAIKLLPQIPFDYVLKNVEPMKERIIKINGYDIVVSVDPIIHSKTLYGAVAIIKRFSDVEKKQHGLRAQLIGKGHRAKYSFDDIIGESEKINKCKNIAKRMAKSNSSVLITGESGTGKELFSQAIHNSSKRKNFQFVAVNCGALPESILESELFGYEEGAFTGARKGGKPGFFELAHRGTLFLDEIGEMPLNLQKRLLRVLQEREIMRIGGDRIIHVDIRVIAATNRDLKEMIKSGQFREDLYYRLNVLPFKIPSLRYRMEDIMPLIDNIKKEFDSDFGFTSEAKKALLEHNWKGNVRELRNCIEYLASLDLRIIDANDFPFFEEENNSEKLFNEDEEIILENFIKKIEKNLNKYIFVLEELENSYKNKKRLGRRSIYQLAKEKGFFISEQEIRSILIELEKHLMVQIFKSRSGTVITEYGIRVLKYFKME